MLYLVPCHMSLVTLSYGSPTFLTVSDLCIAFHAEADTSWILAACADEHHARCRERTRDFHGLSGLALLPGMRTLIKNIQRFDDDLSGSPDAREE